MILTGMPFYQSGGFDAPTSMALATMLGVAFGFVLERAGFGRATVLAAQFYGRDMRVFKVMFTAIATATVGLGLLGGVGLMDLSALQIPETVLYPHLIGGLLLGVGFVVSGYCPGTAVVASAAGHLDGLVSLIGVMAGSVLFAALWPLLEGLYQAGAMGTQTLPSVLGLSWAPVALAVVAMAIGCFLLVEKVERWLNGRDGVAWPLPGHAFRRVSAGLVAAAVVGVLTLLRPPTPSPTSGVAAAAPTGIGPLALAERLTDHASATWVVDLRSPAACAKARIPGALCLPADDLEARFVATLPATRPLVVYGDDDLSELPAAARAFQGPVHVLSGGYAAFQSTLLVAPAPPTSRDPTALAAHRRRAALHGLLTGRTSQPPAPVVAPRRIPRAIKKGGGC